MYFTKEDKRMNGTNLIDQVSWLIFSAE